MNHQLTHILSTSNFRMSSSGSNHIDSMTLEFVQAEQTQVSCLTMDTATVVQPAAVQKKGSSGGADSISINSLKKGFSTNLSPLDKGDIIPNDDTKKI